MSILPILCLRVFPAPRKFLAQRNIAWINLSKSFVYFISGVNRVFILKSTCGSGIEIIHSNLILGYQMIFYSVWINSLVYSIGRASWVAQLVKNLPAVQESLVWSLGWEDPLKESLTTHSNILTRRIPWTEESGRLQPMGWQRVGNDWATKHSTAQHFSSGSSL